MAANESSWNSFARVNASQRWRRPSAAMGRAMTSLVVEQAQIGEGMRVLDVACGTGEPAISIATKLAGTGDVVGLDISPGPLCIAEGRAKERGLKNLRFVPGDVHQLPFEDASFDRVTSRLGIMFFADFPRAAKEICRVLKPEGRATLLAWGPMEQPYFDATIGTILREVPGVTVPASAAAMFKFGQQGALSRALQNAGFSEVRENLREVPWNWPGTAEELWEYFQEVTVPFKTVIEAVPPGRREKVHGEVVQAIAHHQHDGEIRFNAQVVVAGALR